MRPMTASSSDGSESSCQNPASAASPRTRSRQAREIVLAASERAVASRPRRPVAATAVSLTTAILATLRRQPVTPATLRHMSDTHEVTNQVPPLVDYDVFGADVALLEGVERHDAGWALESLAALGRRAGTAEAQEWGRLTNDNPLMLNALDRTGRRIDEVEFYPAWHEHMTGAIG